VVNEVIAGHTGMPVQLPIPGEERLLAADMMQNALVPPPPPLSPPAAPPAAYPAPPPLPVRGLRLPAKPVSVPK
jgi:hypothetical protein